MAATTVMYSIC